jgi:hypothetical protein
MISILINRFYDNYNNFLANKSEIKNNTYPFFYLYIILDIAGIYTTFQTNKMQEDISLIYNSKNDFTSTADASRMVYVEKFTTQKEINKKQAYIIKKKEHKFYEHLNNNYYAGKLIGTSVLLYIGNKRIQKRYYAGDYKYKPINFI